MATLTNLISNATGNVGIGTTSPAYKLEVASGTSGQQSLVNFRTADSTTANNAGIQIFATPSATATSREAVMALDADGANASGGDYFLIKKRGNSGTTDFEQYSNASMRFGTNFISRATYDMTIANDGNVGIGTTNPSGIFHAANLGTANTTSDNFSAYFSSVNRNASIFLLAKNTEGSAFYFGDGDSNTVGALVYEHTTNYLRVDVNGSERMRITADGNVGIGTTSPICKLHVVGANENSFASGYTGNPGLIALYGTDAYNSGTAGSGVFLGGKYDSSGNFTAFATISGIKENSGDVNFAGAMTFMTRTNGSGAGVAERMRIDSLGNVGIGTTSPTAKLQVVGTANAIELKQASVGSATYYVMDNTVETGGKRYRFGYSGASADKGSFSILNVTDNTTSFIITTSGSVGIGTTSPTGKFDVWGGITLDSAGSTDRTLYFRNQSTSTGGTISSDQSITFKAGVSASPSTAVTILRNSLNVGIGTTSPAQRLTINNGSSTGAGAVYPIRLSGGTMTSVGDSTGLLFVQRDANDDYGAYIRLYTTQANPQYLNPRLEFGVQTTDTNVLGSVATRMVITGDGNVGIGTGSPTSKLNVVQTTGADSVLLDLQSINDPGIRFGRSTYGSLIRHISDSTDYIAFNCNGTSQPSVAATAQVVFNENGSVGIGTTSPSARLHIRGGTELLNTSGSTSGATSGSLMIVGQNTKGGANYHDFLYTKNSKTTLNPNKHFRLDNIGNFEIINSAYTSAIFTLTDSGSLVLPTAQARNVTQLRNTGAGLKVGSNGLFFDDGNVHLHSTSPGTNIWLNCSGSGNFIINGQTGATGGVGIGTSTMSGYVTINGGSTVTIGAYGYLINTGSPPTGTGAGTTANYSITCTQRVQATEFDATSDERLKNIEGEIPLNQAVDFVNKVIPIKYKWKDGIDPASKTGYSAQQVYKAGFDHLVGVVKKEGMEEIVEPDGFISPKDAQFVMNYEQVTPYHSKLIKHLLDKVEKLEKEIELLKNRL